MSTVLFSQEDQLAIITLNRPDSFNSVNTELAHQLIRYLDQCREDETVRAIMITGAGKAFCAGQDLKEVTDDDINPGFEVLLTQHYKPIVQRLRGIEKPIVAAVNGVAAGAGANFALACDIVVAHEDANFIQAFSAIGLIPDSGGTYILPRLIGLAKANAIAMLGDKITAQEAERIGMIYKFFSADTFQDESKKIALRLSKMPTHGLGLTKRAFNRSIGNTFDQQLDLETELQVEAANTDDYREGVAAFLEKRKPTFRGK